MVNFITKRAQENFKPPSSGKRGIWAFQIKDLNKKHHVKLLSEHFVECRVHYIKGKPPTFCQKQYFDNDDPSIACEHCPAEDDTSWKKNPWLVRLFIGYVFELVGKKGKSKQGKEFDENPVKIISVPSGKKKCNFKPFDDAVENQMLTEIIWEIEQDDDGFVVPAPTMNPKKLGEQYDLTLPDAEAAKYAAKTMGEVMSIELATLAGILWNHPDFVTNGLANPVEDAEETSEEQAEVTSESFE